MKSKQEERLDAELDQMGVKVHITHLKQPEGCHYNMITVATQLPVAYLHLDIALSTMYLEAQVHKRSDLGKLLIDRFDELGAGVALCHHLDQHNKGLSRIIAKGRLLKLLDMKEQS